MLDKNIKTLRIQKGLSQEELAMQLNVVRQTISKWEKGLSVPDADMLICLADALDSDVNELLKESNKKDNDDIKSLGQRLEVINQELVNKSKRNRKIICGVLIGMIIFIVLNIIVLYLMNSPYLNWNYQNIQTALIATFYQSYEWLFIRVAPIILVILIVIFIVLKNR